MISSPDSGTAALTAQPSARPSGTWRSLPPDRIAPALLLLILPFTHTTALRSLCLLLCCVIVLFSWVREGFELPPFWKSYAAWALVGIGAVVWSVDPVYSLDEAANELIYAALAGIAFFTLTRGSADWARWINVLWLQFFVMCGFAIATRLAFGRWHSDPQGGAGNFSTYLVLVSPLLLMDAAQGTRAKRWLGAAALVLLISTGLLTRNAMVWPALIISAATVFFLMRRRLKAGGASTRRLDFGAAVLICIIAIAGAEIARAKWFKRFDLDRPASTVRVDPRLAIWDLATDKIAARPFAGYGFGRGILRAEFRETLGSPLQWHPHNLLLSQALQMGLIGLIAFCVLLVHVARCLARGLAADHARAGAAIAGLAILAGFLVKNMSDDFFNRDVAMLFWALLNMCLAMVCRDAGRPA